MIMCGHCTDFRKYTRREGWGRVGEGKEKTKFYTYHQQPHLKKVGLDNFTGKLGSNWLAYCHTNQIAWGGNYTYKSSQIPSLPIFGGQSLLLATHYYDHWVGHDTEASWGQLASALAGEDGAVAIKIWNQCITGCKSKFARDYTGLWFEPMYVPHDKYCNCIFRPCYCVRSTVVQNFQ